MDYLKVWTSFREVIATLNDGEKGRLFDAMLLYAETGEEPSEFKGNERYLWAVAKQDIDRTAQKCETLKANASKGGIAKNKRQQMIADDSKSYQTVADVSKSKQTETNPAHKSNNNDNVIIKKSNNNTPSECRRFTPPTVEQVRDYCRERGNSVDPEKFVDFYTSKGWKVGKDPMKDWKASVRTWEKDSKPQKQESSPAGSYHQRDYSSEQQEAMKRFIRMNGGG